MPLKFLRKFVFIHHNGKHLYYFREFFTLAYIYDSSYMHVIFE
jgi:hypothetical protein